MTVNPLGAVVVFDGENPRTFTGRARTAISGGNLVVVSGAPNAVSSGTDSFATSDIVIDILNNSNFCNGISLNTVGSNGLVTVATRGVYIMRAAGAVSGGVSVVPFSGTNQAVIAQAINAASSGTTIGRAMTAIGSGTTRFGLIDLNL